MKLSIITPSYNQGKFIERTINSVINQDGANYEYIVIDGGSSDNTLEILQRYADKISFISESDNGQAHAVNKGILRTSGEIIGWLNSDDIYYPHTFQKVLDLFEKNYDLQIVYGRAFNIDENDKIIEYYPTAPYNFSQLINHCFISQPAVFFRRDLIKKYGLLNESLNFCMDFEYWLRLGKKQVKFMYVTEVLAGSRIHGATKTNSQAAAMQQEVLSMLKNQIGYVPTRWFLTAAFAEITAKKIGKNFLTLPFLVLLKAIQRSIYFNGHLQSILVILKLPFAAIHTLKNKLRHKIRCVTKTF